MSIIVTGSVAYDYLMSFPGRFREHLLPDQLDRVSLSFLVDSMRKERGGCAPNIAYSLALLGERPKIMATVGQDFAEYRAWLEQAGVDTSEVVEIVGEFTASFFVNTDQDNNQIASFYIGAMSKADQLSFHHLNTGEIELAIISPNSPGAMTKYVRECRELGVPFIYDPSQQIVRLTGAELLEGIEGARLLIVNEYEFGLLANRTGLSERALLAIPGCTIVTQGAQGSTIHAEGQAFAIPTAPPDRLGEPTGVGDAYRAGVMAGMLRGYPWEVVGRMGALAATYVLEQVGTQNHRYSLDEFAARYERVFGPTPELNDLVRPRGR